MKIDIRNAIKLNAKEPSQIFFRYVTSNYKPSRINWIGAMNIAAMTNSITPVGFSQPTYSSTSIPFKPDKLT